MLSAIMSASMTFLVSSSYCDPSIDLLLPIWVKAWATAFTVIFLLTPSLHGITAYLLKLKNA